MTGRIMILGCLLVLFSAGSVFGGHGERRYYATVDPDGVQRVEVLAGSYFFDPSVIRVKVNVPVELNVRSTDGATPHDIVLQAPRAGIDFRQELGPAAVSIRFTPTRVGQYSFRCSKRFLFFESHQDRGMHGVLEVVE